MAGYAPDTPSAMKRTRTRRGALRFQPDESDWTIDKLTQLETDYQSQFGSPLPIKNRGQGGIHNRWHLDHRDSADISINPATSEGQKFLDFLEQRNTPFLAFDRAIPGVATGAHVHVGRPSKRGYKTANISNAGNVGIAPENDLSTGTVKDAQSPNDPTLDLSAGISPPGLVPGTAKQGASSLDVAQSKVPPSSATPKRPAPPPIKLPDVRTLPVVQEAERQGPTYNPSALYDTRLSPAEEGAYQQWKSQYAPNDSGEDYDLRGAFKAGLTPDANTGHFPDTFKKPNHPTFSRESQYATGENLQRAGTWDGDRFISPYSDEGQHGEIGPLPPGTAERMQQYSQIDAVSNAAVAEIARRRAAAQTQRRRQQARAAVQSRNLEVKDEGQGQWSFTDPRSNMRVFVKDKEDLYTEIRKRAGGGALRTQMISDAKQEMIREAEQAAKNAEPSLAQKILDQARNAKPDEVVQWARNQRNWQEKARGQAFVERMNEGMEVRGGFRVSKPNIAQQIAMRTKADVENRQRRDQSIRAEARRVVVSRNGGEDNLARIKADYQAVGSDPSEVDRRVNEQIEAEVNRRQFAEMDESDQAEINVAAKDILNVPGFLRGANVGLDRSAMMIPAAAAGMTRILGDLTNSDAIRGVAAEYQKEVNKRQIAQEWASKELSGVNQKVEAATQLVGDVVQLAALSEILGPTKAMSASSGLSTLGSTGDYGQALLEAGKGAVYGEMFKFLPHLERFPGAKTTLQKLANLSVDTAAVGTGTYALERATGKSHEEALHAAITNSAIAGVMRLTEIVPNLVEAAAEPIVRNPKTPEWLRNKLADYTDVRKAVFYSEDGRAMSVYGDPKSQGVGGSEIPFSKVEQYAADRPVVRVTNEQFNELADLVKSKRAEPAPQAQPEALPPGPAEPPTGEARPTTPPVPETPETLMKQMETLADGRRDAVLVTPGGETPTPPKNVQPVITKVGIFFIDPARVTPETVQRKVADGTYGDLLGHVEPKPAPGAPAAVVTANEGGTEVQTSVVSPESAPAQAAVTQKQNPEAQVTVGGPELADQVVADRIGGIDRAEIDKYIAEGGTDSWSKIQQRFKTGVGPSSEISSYVKQRTSPTEKRPGGPYKSETELPEGAIVLPDGKVRIKVAQEGLSSRFQTYDSIEDYHQQTGQSERPVTPAPQVGDVFTHSNPDFDGKRVVGTTDDGRAILTNPNNKTGISRVKPERRSGQDRRVTEGQAPLGMQERRDRLARRLKQERSERRSAERERDTDELTGLANQRAWLKAKTAAEADPNTTILSVDFNNFKAVNDRLGHESGDKVLQTGAAAVMKAAKEFGENRVFRSGGDEITLAVPKDKAEAIANRIEDLGAHLHDFEDLTSSLSVGRGKTLAEADRDLGPRKAARKGAGTYDRETGVAKPEKHPVTGRRFSSTQVDLPAAFGKNVIEMGRRLIPDSDLAGDGREESPHITVKYGLHGEDVAPLQELLANENPFKVRTAAATSMFPGPPDGDYEVIKVDVRGPEIHRLNKAIANAVPVTDTHPEYIPHLTIAYVKKGKGQKYVGNSLPGVTNQEVTFSELTFSSRNGEEITIPLGGKGNATETGIKPEDDLSQYQGTTPRQHVREDEGQVRSGQGAQPGNRDRDAGSRQTETEQTPAPTQTKPDAGGSGKLPAKTLSALKQEFPVNARVEFSDNAGHRLTGTVQHHRIDAPTLEPFMVMKDARGKMHDVGADEYPKRLDAEQASIPKKTAAPTKPDLADAFDKKLADMRAAKEAKKPKPLPKKLVDDLADLFPADEGALRLGGEAPSESPAVLEFKVDRNRVDLGSLEGADILGTALMMGKARTSATTLRPSGIFIKDVRPLLDGLSKIVAQKRRVFELSDESRRLRIRRANLAERMSESVREAAKNGNGRVILHLGDKSLRHELFHEASAKSAYTAFAQRHGDVDSLVFHPKWDGMRRILIERRGYADFEPSLIEEAAAIISEGSYADLDLTRDEAIDWMDRWFSSFAEINGDVSLAEFRELAHEAETARQQIYDRRAKGDQSDRISETLPGVESARQSRLRKELAPLALSREQVDSPAFKRWFGESQIVDENGAPQVVYHFTSKDAEPLIKEQGFDLSKARARRSDEGVPDGVFFTPDPKPPFSDDTEFGRIEAFLKMEKPLRVDTREDLIQWAKSRDHEYAQLQSKAAKYDDPARMRLYQDMQSETAAVKQRAEKEYETLVEDATAARARLTEVIRREGHDGVILERDIGGSQVTKTLVVLNPTQVKSATGNRGDFDPSNPSIMASAEARPPVDEARYGKAKGLFQSVLEHYEGMDAVEALPLLLEELHEQNNFTLDQIEKMKPYVLRFMEEWEQPATVDESAHEAAASPQNGRPEPSEAQKAAGNYKKGHVVVSGLDLSIENPQGSTRSGVDQSGKQWEIKLKSHYGYIKGYEGKDKDHIDVFVKPDTPTNYEGPVYVVNQTKGNGHFDEHKVMLGWSSIVNARAGYLENYEAGWDRMGTVTKFDTVADFQNWLDNGDLAKPAIRLNDPYAKPPASPDSAEEWAHSLNDAIRKYGTRRIFNVDGEAFTTAGPPANEIGIDVINDRTKSGGSLGWRGIDRLVDDTGKTVWKNPNPSVRSDLDQSSTKEENTGDESTAGDIQANPAIREGVGGTANAGDAATDVGVGQSEGTRAPGRSGRSDTDVADVGAAPGTSAGTPSGPEQSTPGGSRNPRASRPPVTPARSNFTITDELDFSGIGDRQRYKNNVAAIKLLRTLEAEKREATPEEQAALARYTGWGGLKGVFDANNKQWKDAHREIKDLLTVPEYDAARRSVLDAHYTAKAIVDAVWKAVRRLGFERGAVWEPTMGTGNFFGLMPPAVRRTSSLTGVEQDHITGAIAKHLYPLADIHAPVGVHQFNVPQEHFDLAIGNPPFGDQSIYDPRYPQHSKFKIHAFVFAKSIESLRPGGILAMVVSKGLLDATDAKATKARQWLSSNTRLLGAIRLPNTTFRENAGTEVTTDLVFLQKLGPGIEPNATEWMLTGEVKDPESGNPITINNYFVRNPDMMLGTMELKGTMYRADEPALIAKPGADLVKELEAALEKLPQDIYTTGASTALAVDQPSTATTAVERRPYSYFLENGKVKQQMPETMGTSAAVDVTLTGNPLERMKGLIGLREQVRTLLESEAADNPPFSDKALEAQRASLNKTYDAFVKRFGYVGNDTNKRMFREDSDFPLLLSLEKNFDKGVSADTARKNKVEARPATAEKSDIFFKRTVNPIRRVSSVDTAGDALVASINEKGRIDLSYMAKLYGKPENQIISELGDKVFHDPTLDEHVVTDAYLSGDVKTKLEQARQAAEKDGAYKRNVEALEKVIPADVPASDIFVKLGSTWVPPEDYARFVAETLEGSFSGKFNAATGHWVGLSLSSKNSTLNEQRWGTKDAPATLILGGLLKNQRPVVYGEDADGRRFVREDETLAAQAKADELIEEFADWIWRDGERRSRVSSLYNELFNRSVVRKFDGSNMRYPGMNRNVEMRPHQMNAIFRALQDGNILLDHVVGAGKTYAFASMAMEMRRLGLAHKPMIVVPNHLVEQWATEFKHLYPNARVLAATRKDFQKKQRRQLFARIATGDWDAVIVAHSSFGFIPVPPETEAKLLQEQFDELLQALTDAKAERGDRHTIRDLEKAKEKIEAKLKRLADKAKDDMIDFAQMGVDALMVDEAHEFKNLFFVTTKKGVAGLGNPAGSQKAFDLFIKTRYLHQKNGGRGVYFATGTPVANSISEVYHMQRYLQYDLLKQRGIHQFDAWANTFGQDVTDWEMDAAGRFRQKTRFSKFANLPELKQMWRAVTDVVMRSDLIADAEAQGKRFPLPKIKGGKPENVVLERSEQQADFIGVPKPVLDDDGNPAFSDETGEPLVRFEAGTIVDRLENWTQRVKMDPTEIPLKITGEARKAGLDFRLIQSSSPDFKGSKVNAAVEKIVSIWKREAHRQGTQLVFCDLSTPKAHKGKATEAAQAKLPSYFVSNGETVTHVDGKKVRLLAASDYDFFYTKDKGVFTITEVRSGRSIGKGRSLEEARDQANSAIAKIGLEKFAEAVKKQEIPRAQIDEYLHEWERQQQEVEEVDDDAAVEEEETISLDELLADQGGPFSVYDDMKAKLIQAGVPESEIAFIHDYETDIQKQSLFNKVNRGLVRVLFGSTKKMGAGMNVQQRLIALHHMDAPWRPADLEQREGRIIRQGNLFYNDDPDGFEIEIYRYATKQTYDTRMWEIIEQKARSIETFKADDTLREIEDISSESANAAEMKAGASGDPRILESIQLRNDIRKLEAQEKAFKRSRFDLQDKVKQVETESGWPWTSLKSTEKALSRVAEKTDETKITIGKVSVAVFEVAKKDGSAALVSELAPILKALTGKYEKRNIGNYRNVNLELADNGPSAFFINFYQGDHKLGDARYSKPNAEKQTEGDKVSISGLVNRIDNAIEALPKEIDSLKLQVQKKEHEAETAREELEKPWAKADELAIMRERSRKLVTELRGGKIQKTEAGQEEPLPESIDGLTREIERLVRAKAEIDQTEKKGRERYGQVNSRLNKAIAARERLVEDGIQERHSGIPFLRSLFGGRSRYSTVRDPLLESDYDEVERRWQAAKGLQSPGMLRRAGEALRLFYRAFKRHYLHLDPNANANTALTTDILRLLEASPAWAKATAYDHLAEITGTLDAKALDVMTRNLVLPDILKDIEEGLYSTGDEADADALRELPFGYKSREEIEYDLEKFQVLAEVNPAISDALERRRATAQAITRRLVELDLLDPSVLEDDRYYHRQVMKYANQDTPSTGTSSNVRQTTKGFQRERVGGGDFNTRYQEAEFEWIAQAYSMIAKAETLDQLDHVNNIAGDLKRMAKTLNELAVQARYPGDDVFKPFRMRIGMANGDLRRFARDGVLISAGGRYAELINDLATSDPDRPFNHPDWFGFLAHLIEEELTGAGQAKTIFKAIADRNRFIREELGREFKTWQSLVPDTHAVWQPEKGNQFYMGRTIDQKVLDQVLAGEKELEAADVRNNLVMGRRKEEWVIPKELALTLDDNRVFETNPLSRLSELVLNTWKQWVLLAPTRSILYNFNNMSGDLDIALSVDPRVLKEFRQAARDLWAYMVHNRAGTATKAELLQATRLGVIDSGLTIQEIPDINQAGAFRTLLETDQNLLQRGVNSYWSGVKTFTAWRENILRLAAWRFARGQMRAGKKFYAASTPKQVDAIRDVDQRAAKVAREWIGDYGNISVAGQWIRRHMYPFYSWVEINLPRYARILRNTAHTDSPGGSAFKVGAVTGKRLLMFALKAHIIMGLLALWNFLFFRNEEKELGDNGRQPHLNLGRAPDGTIRTIKFQGAFADALEWFSLDDYPSDVRDLIAGKKDWRDQAAETAKAPVERFVNSSRPFDKALFESITGRSLYPHFFAPGKSFELQTRPIRDRGRHLAQVVALTAIYDRVTGKPVRPSSLLWKPLEATIVYRTDPGEAAYFETRAKLISWQKAQGRAPSFGGDPTERQNALYYFKQASKWGDDQAAQRWLEEYRRLGGTDKGLTQSVRAAHPLGSLARKDWDDFKSSLSSDELAMLQIAEDWYNKTYEGTGEAAIDKALMPPTSTRRVGPAQPKMPRGPKRR